MRVALDQHGPVVQRRVGGKTGLSRGRRSSRASSSKPGLRKSSRNVQITAEIQRKGNRRRFLGKGVRLLSVQQGNRTGEAGISALAAE